LKESIKATDQAVKAMADREGKYLTFTLAKEEYGIGILKVKEIIEYDAALTKVPNMPPSVRGVINLRGSVVPVVDLALKFGLPERPVTKRTCVVIVEAGNHLPDLIRDLVNMPPGNCPVGITDLYGLVFVVGSRRLADVDNRFRPVLFNALQIKPDSFGRNVPENSVLGR